MAAKRHRTPPNWALSRALMWIRDRKPRGLVNYDHVSKGRKLIASIEAGEAEQFLETVDPDSLNLHESNPSTAEIRRQGTESALRTDSHGEIPVVMYAHVYDEDQDLERGFGRRSDGKSRHEIEAATALSRAIAQLLGEYDLKGWHFETTSHGSVWASTKVTLARLFRPGSVERLGDAATQGAQNKLYGNDEADNDTKRLEALGNLVEKLEATDEAFILTGSTLFFKADRIVRALVLTPTQRQMIEDNPEIMIDLPSLLRALKKFNAEGQAIREQQHPSINP